VKLPDASRSEAEEYLLEQGAITKRSQQRRELLGCLACQWQRSLTVDNDEVPRAHGYQVTKCTGGPAGTVYPSLKRLENAGALTSHIEDMDRSSAKGSPRTYYTPADTELGLGLAYMSTKPLEVCGFEAPAEAEPSDASMAPSEKEAGLNLVIAVSSRDELEYLIAQATQRLEALDNPPPA
jgi:hypothetical protein